MSGSLLVFLRLMDDTSTLSLNASARDFEIKAGDVDDNFTLICSFYPILSLSRFGHHFRDVPCGRSILKLNRVRAVSE